MRVVVIQPPYAHSPEAAEASFQFLLRQLAECSPDLDLILLPEYANAPSAWPDAESLRAFAASHTEPLLAAAVNAARRCQAIVAVNFACPDAAGNWRNTTRVLDWHGNVAGEYFKQHLTWGERQLQMDDSYVTDATPPAVIEVDGLRLAFLICYDCYFDEYVANLARLRPDLVLISAFQRGERPEVLETQVQNCAFHCNAFAVRASYSMGTNAATGGHSMVASPEGRLLAKFGQETGRLECELGIPTRKHMRSNTFGGKPIDNFQFIEQGRTPWAYRPAGPMTVRNDLQLPYPRICAHRGFNTIASENSLPAFGAAIALGAEEIEFDIHLSKDGTVVSCHDDVLERVSDGSGRIADHPFAELREMDFGSKHSARFQGLRLPTMEQILAKFARHCIFNVHVKDQPTPELSRELVTKAAALLHRHDCAEHAYFMGSPAIHRLALELCPEIHRCMGYDGTDQIVTNAIEYKCHKVQLFKPYFDQRCIDRAHAHGILCNVFWSDEPEEARRFLQMGIDCILTNDYLQIARALKRY